MIKVKTFGAERPRRNPIPPGPISAPKIWMNIKIKGKFKKQIMPNYNYFLPRVRHREPHPQKFEPSPWDSSIFGYQIGGPYKGLRFDNAYPQ